MCKKDVEGAGYPSLTLGSPLLSPAFFLFLLGCRSGGSLWASASGGFPASCLGVSRGFFLLVFPSFLVGSCRRSCSCVLRFRGVGLCLALPWPVGCACRCWRLGCSWRFAACSCVGCWRLLGPARLRLAALLLGCSLGGWLCACSCGVAPFCCRLGFARGSGRGWLFLSG